MLRLYIFINSQEHIELKIAAKPLPDWARQTAKDWASQLNSGGAGSGGGGGGGSDSDAEDFDPFDNGSSSSSGGAAIMCRMTTRLPRRSYPTATFWNAPALDGDVRDLHPARC